MTEFDPATYGASGIADEYDDLYANEWDTEHAVRRLAELAAGGSVLEFGIGSGRLALPLQALGLELAGIDGSEPMVRLLRSKPGGESIAVEIGDFSDVRLERRFSLVLLAVNTIYALPDQDRQIECFRNAARHLDVGGRFVVEAWVPDLAAFRNHRLVRQRVTRGDVISIESVQHDPVAQMMRTTQAVLRNDSVRLYPANHRYAWPSELDLMARLAGFALESRHGGWNGEPFVADSKNHVSIYLLEQSLTG